MAHVQLTIEEYDELTRMAMNGHGSCASCMAKEQEVEVLPTKRSRKKTKSDKNMSKALERANELGRKQNGDLRKGWNQARIMKTAHRLKRQMS